MSAGPLYYVWERAIPPGVCDQVVNEWNETYAIPGGVEQNDGSFEVDLGYRVANTVRFAETHWVHALPHHYARLANESEWQFELSGLADTTLTRYSGGGHYTWHQDRPAVPSSGSERPNNRKLSIVASLTDSAEFEGGALKFLDADSREIADERVQWQGSVTVFPSDVWHSVEPVTAGERYSLVSWFLGAE